MALVAMAVIFSIGVLGCVDPKTESQPDKKDQKTANSVNVVGNVGGGNAAKSDQQTDDTIDGFWCEPHGLPEDKCWKCNKAFCRQCEKDGDWCKEHLRPKSQCFKCDATLIDKWAKVYEARTGKTAPKPRNY
jgi:hypothetical protein